MFQVATTSGMVRVGLVLDDSILPIEALAAHHPTARILSEASTASELTPGIQGLLTNWEQSFQALFELAAFVTSAGFADAPLAERPVLPG